MPTWLDWKLIIGVCSLSFAVFTFIWNRRSSRKELSYELSITHINALDNELAGQLQLTFAGKHVTNVSFAKISLRNSGRKTIESKDFDGDIVIHIICDELLWYDLAETDTPSLNHRIAITQDNCDISVAPLMLNSGDTIDISMLITSYHKLWVMGRIAEVKEIKDRSARRRIPRHVNLVISVMSIFAFGIGLYSLTLAWAAAYISMPTKLFMTIIVVCMFVAYAVKIFYD
jgi:hypothetical protein